MSTHSPRSLGALDVHIRRGIWIAWAITMVIASVLYALKAADSRSAFVRWQKQVSELPQGVNIWDRYYFPNPPILPLTLYPLMKLPPVVGAMAWYAIKVCMATWCFVALARMARGRGRELPSWAIGLIIVLSIRPILSDLQHGNINILIMFLVVASLEMWRRGRDISAGLILGLAIAYKVTPGLLLPYFAYKRSWKAVSACLVGLFFYLLVIPSLILGPSFNWECLMEWKQNIISPYVEGEVIPSVQEVNQSMPGVLTRLLTQPKTVDTWKEDHYHYNNGIAEHDLNLLSLDPQLVTILVKAMALAFVGLLAYFCRTRTTRRDDPRLLGEFSLVVLTMLFISERSWKHHFVTLLLPYTYLVYQVGMIALNRRARGWLIAALAASALLILTTSSEVGGLFGEGRGHEHALYYGMFFWSGLILYVATAWRVASLRVPDRAFDQVAPEETSSSLPHFGRATRPAAARS